MTQANRTHILSFAQIPTADEAQAGDRLILTDVPGAQAICMPLPEQARAILATPAFQAVLGAALLKRQNYWRWNEPRQALPVTAAPAVPPRYHLIVDSDGANDSKAGMPQFNLLNLNPQNNNPDLGNVAPGIKNPRTITNFVGQANKHRLVGYGANTTSFLFNTDFYGYASALLIGGSSDPLGIVEELPKNTTPVGGVNLAGLSIGSGYVELGPGADYSQGSLVFWNDTTRVWDQNPPTKLSGLQNFAAVLLAASTDQVNPSITDRPFACLLSPRF